MKKSIMYSLHGFIWICDLCIIFLATLAGGLWINETILASIAILLGIFIWSLVLFYAGYSLFVPRLFAKQKHMAFATSILATSIIFPLIPNFNKVISAMSGNGWMGYSVSGFVQVAILCFIIITSGGILRVFIDWIVDQQKKKELENEKVNSKLLVLVNQNNPHFIFNVLNNIDSLITTKPAKASEMIYKLSGLLRYIYSNSDKDKVSLTSEIGYVENYIELQSLRLESKIRVNLKKDSKLDNIDVAPMLFLPFVENAFKHGLVDEQHPIDIHISAESGEILFACSNHYHASVIDQAESGFGMSNIIKRLDLMYPSKYTLNIENRNNIYSVTLTLIIDEN